MALIQFGQGLYANYAALASKDQYQVYFCTDTHQIFVGADEYTKGTKVLNAEPTSSTEGDQDRLYAYNGSLYLMTGKDGNEYTWLRVANINDTAGTVTSITAGNGLTTGEGANPITGAGTISHAIPAGASTVADTITDQTPGFGSTFAIEGIATDEFGHVTGVNEHTVTLPTETPVTIDPQADEAETLAFGSTFAAITGVAVDATNNHEVETTQTIFTIPQVPDAVTYEISSDAEGVVKLTDSEGNYSTAVIDGWGDLAKKSDITAVFRYKGAVQSVSDLPTVGEVGDVYQVRDTNSEYVCVQASTTDPQADAVWEELGPVIDLSAYATTAYVDDRLSWKTF